MYSSYVAAIEGIAKRTLPSPNIASLHSMWVDFDFGNHKLVIHSYCDSEATSDNKADVDSLASKVAEELDYIFGDTWNVSHEVHELQPTSTIEMHEIELFVRQ